MPLDLYMIEPSPPCRAVWMTCAALGLDVNIKTTTPGDTGTNTPEFRKINHHHCVPTIDDDGFILWESRAIMRYLSDKYGETDELYPKDVHKRAIVDRLLDHDASSLYPAVHIICFSRVLMMEAQPAGSLQRLELLLQELNAAPGLWDHDFLTGDSPTLADFSIVCSLSFLEPLDYVFSRFPNVDAWRKRMAKLPYFGSCHVGFRKFKNDVKTPEYQRAAAARRRQVREKKPVSETER